MTWSITLQPDAIPDRTRVFLRLRAAPVRRRRLMEAVGGFFDASTVAVMAAGLRERLAETTVVSGSVAPAPPGR